MYLCLSGVCPAAVLSVLLVALPACKDKSPSERSSQASGDAIKTQPANPDPCAWVSTTEVEQIVGKLKGPPRRGRNAENPKPDDDGQACVYTLADAGGQFAGTGEIAVQVKMEDATASETGFSMVGQKIEQEFGPAAGDSAAEGAAADTASPGQDDGSGWDFTGALPSLWTGRQGHMAIEIGLGTMTVKPEKIEELAAKVRDRVPDLPVAAQYGDPRRRSGGNDPCALVTRAEAEAVMGKLAIDPYRSKKATPFADGDGSSCSYYRGKHRVLVLAPIWEDGRFNFGMGSGLTQQVTTATGVGGQSADTLEGPWDQASSGLDGTLYFLKGDKMLEVQYQIAGIDAAAATKLATIAVGRL